MTSRLMTDASNRTFVCSVVFLDIIEYSKRSVTEQLKLKQRFNALLSDALQQVAVIDRIVLDTGDGAAISFLGNPDDSLFVAMKLRDALANESPRELPPLLVRIGINLGPVRLIKDINDQLNIIGDGINVAQRVMSFAEPGRILVSRSYYEVISRLSDDYGQIFRYEGTRTDKHVREHSVYVVAPAARDSGTVAATRAATRPQPHSTAGTASARLARTLHVRTGIRPPLLFASLALAVAMLAAGGAIRAQRTKSAPVQLTAMAPPPATVAKPTEAPAPVNPVPPTAVAVTPDSPPASPAPRQHREAATPTDIPQARAEAPAKGHEKAAAAGKAGVRLAIVPWGEIYVDGQKKGVSPPLRFITLTPGRHVIELRNANLPPYRKTIDVKAGDMLKLQHRF